MATFEKSAAGSDRLRAIVAFLAMLAGVLAVYWPPTLAPGDRQFASDFMLLHERRMSFAREAILAPTPSLPDWYPRELLGTPFWANVQNFPFVPTRLLVLLALDPAAPRTYATAVNLSAMLAAAFTFAYCRRLRLGAVASAAAGWTFACAGFYASRVAAGHLPLLEAYPALPMLLWAAESLVLARADPATSRVALASRHLALGLATTGALLVGHPQLSIYALAATALYVAWRSMTVTPDADAIEPLPAPRVALRRVAAAWGTIALGAGVAAFALVPMALLTARSTRTLALAAPDNDLALPYERLLAWFRPGRDGYPRAVADDAANHFHGYATDAMFWDTSNYVGLLPWLALVACVVVARVPRRQRSAAWFLVAMGVLAVAFALPWWQQVTRQLPGTFLRSPARLIYLAEFGLAVAVAVAADALLRRPGRVPVAIVGVALAAHFVDLRTHDRRFARSIRIGNDVAPAQAERLRQLVGDGRVAIDAAAMIGPNRRLDDVGFFDSIMLARSYRLALGLGGAPAEANVQQLDGSELTPRALAALGVRFVLTGRPMPGLPVVGKPGPSGSVYGVPYPADRAAFFPAARLKFLDPAAIHAIVRDPNADVTTTLMLPPEARALVEGDADDPRPTRVDYVRDAPDQIRCAVVARVGGVLRVIESYDPGWTATLDGRPVPIVAAQDALLAVAVPAGAHDVIFTYRTPGATAGRWIAAASLLGLLLAAWTMSRPPRED